MFVRKTVTNADTFFKKTHSKQVPKVAVTIQNTDVACLVGMMKHPVQEKGLQFAFIFVWLHASHCLPGCMLSESTSHRFQQKERQNILLCGQG